MGEFGGGWRGGDDNIISMKDRMRPIEQGERVGLAAERRFMRETQKRRDMGMYPSWLGFFDKARPDEDAQGIDVWAYTDVGKIPLQIKASDIGQRLHELRDNRRHIPAINLHPKRKFDEIFEEIIEIVAEERNAILEKKKSEKTE